MTHPPASNEAGYYGRPIIEKPVWTWEIPVYFAAGGVAGASSVLAEAARAIGDDDLAMVARRAAAMAGLASPVLLVSDLGRPERFVNMLRVFRPTSPMNMGAWLLSAFVPCAVAAALPRGSTRAEPLARMAGMAAAALGPGMATYTAVLVADTAVPAWHDARLRLPALFAGSSLAGAGALATLFSRDRTGLGRAAAATGAIVSLGAAHLVEGASPAARRSFGRGRARRLGRLADVATAAGALLLRTGRGGRRRTVAGSVALLAGVVLERFAVMWAGVQSASEPQQVIEGQGRRTRSGSGSVGGSGGSGG